MSKNKPPPALRDLDAKLRQAQDKQERAKGKTRSRKAQDMSGIGLAMRMGLDFVAGVVVGVVIGLLLDWWLGTLPWMLIAFFFLGAAAGTFNVIRTASGQDSAIGYRPAERKTGPDEKESDDSGPEE